MTGRFGAVKGGARREPWGTAVEIGDGLFRVRLDNTVGPLMVNTYVYRGPDALIVVDPGWPWTLDALEQSLRDLGLARSFADVDAWLYTHTHIDHMGPAALLSEISEAPHYAWSAVEAHVEEWHRFQQDVSDWTAWGYSAFVGREFGDQLAADTLARRAKGVEYMLDAHGEKPVRNLRYLEFDEEFAVSDLRLKFLDARGHDPFHGAFFEPDRGWLFAGDVAIATPTPICPAMNDDLDLYLGSLGRLEALPTTLLLPGHGVQRSGDLTAVYARSRAYQVGYTDQLMQLLDMATEPLDLFTIGLRTTPDGRPFEGGARWMVHLALLDSHLARLVRDGLVEIDDGPHYAIA